MKSNPNVCLPALGRYLRYAERCLYPTVCPSAPSMRSGWPDPTKKNIVHSSYGPPPLAPTIPLDPFEPVQSHQSRILDNPNPPLTGAKSSFGRVLYRDSIHSSFGSYQQPSSTPCSPPSSIQIIDLASELLPAFPHPHSRRVHLKSVLSGLPSPSPQSAFDFGEEFCCLLDHHR